MSNNFLLYPAGCHVDAKIESSPIEAAPGGILVVYDAAGTRQRRIDLSQYRIGAWIPVTSNDFELDDGKVVAHLLRIHGSGSWSATLRLRARPPQGNEATDTDSDDQDVLAPSAFFRRQP